MSRQADFEEDMIRNVRKLGNKIIFTNRANDIHVHTELVTRHANMVKEQEDKRKPVKDSVRGREGK